MALQQGVKAAVENANTVGAGTKNPFPGMAKFVDFTPKKLGTGTGGSLGTPKFSPTANKIPLPGMTKPSKGLSRLDAIVKGPNTSKIGELAKGLSGKISSQTSQTNPKCPKCGLPTMTKETDNGLAFICPKDGDIASLGNSVSMNVPTGGIQVGQPNQVA
jgi:hypothetical protein